MKIFVGRIKKVSTFVVLKFVTRYLPLVFNRLFLYHFVLTVKT